MPSDRLQAGLWVGLGLAFLWLLHLLSPILAPFLLAGVLAYICDPLVEKLEHRGLGRTGAVLLVMALLSALLVALVLILVPLVRDEATLLAARLPQAIALFNERAAPWLREHAGIRLQLDAGMLQQLVGENRDALGSLAGHLLESLKIGGVALFGLIANLLLAPVAMFYLLRDWNGLVERVGHLVPRPWQAQAFALFRDVDSVLAEFLRGQIAVMMLLAVYYSAGLWLADVDFALPVGIVTGLLIFIPYLGFALGLTLALFVATLQFAGIGPVVGVGVVFGIGQMLESLVLTPYLVGERIGLHPLAAIFALLAFGQLFGFTGVLVALPASAALLVGLRALRRRYLESGFYKGPARP